MPMLRGRRLPLVLVVFALALGALLLALKGSRPPGFEGSKGPTRAAKAAESPPSSKLRAGREAFLRRRATQRSGDAGGPTTASVLLLRAAWGAAPGELGRRPARESNPQGPMSLVADGQGGVWLLDGINWRLQRFDAAGRLQASKGLPVGTAQDLALSPDGRLWVLDRLGAAPGLYHFPPGAESPTRLALPPSLAAKPGAISGVFCDAEGIYLEDAHDQVLRIADATGHAVAPDSVPGRPSRDGQLYLRAGIVERSAGRLYVQAHRRDRSLAWERLLNLGGPLLQILMLDSDAQGNVYLGAEIHDSNGRGGWTAVARLEGGNGRLSGELTLPPTSAEGSESFRPLTVSSTGEIQQLLHGAEAATVRVYRFP